MGPASSFPIVPFRPGRCLLVALRGPALAFWLPLWAQNIFKSASRGPAPPPPGGVYGPTFRPRLAATSVDSSPAPIPEAFVGPKAQALGSGSPGPRNSCLILAFRAQLLPSQGVSRPQTSSR
ncbi:hypothetical protein AAY473_033834 [Plecturocebus cupreus]